MGSLDHKSNSIRDFPQALALQTRMLRAANRSLSPEQACSSFFKTPLA